MVVKNNKQSYIASIYFTAVLLFLYMQWLFLLFKNHKWGIKNNLLFYDQIYIFKFSETVIMDDTSEKEKKSAEQNEKDQVKTAYGVLCLNCISNLS